MVGETASWTLCARHRSSWQLYICSRVCDGVWLCACVRARVCVCRMSILSHKWLSVVSSRATHMHARACTHTHTHNYESFIEIDSVVRFSLAVSSVSHSSKHATRPNRSTSCWTNTVSLPLVKAESNATREVKRCPTTRAAANEYFGNRLLDPIFHRFIESSDKTCVCLIRGHSAAELQTLTAWYRTKDRFRLLVSHWKESVRNVSFKLN